MTPSDSVSGATPRHSPLLPLAGLLVIGTLAAVLLVQLRQYGLVSKVVEYERDYAVIALTQLEVEYLRLREVVALHERGAVVVAGQQDLPLRYEIFVSRIGLFEGRHARALVERSTRSAALLQQLDAFVELADELLPVALANQDGGRALRELLAALQALDAPIHQLMVEATLEAATHVSDRTRQMRQYQHSTLFLGALLATLVLAAAALAWRQARAQRQAHQRLLDLTGQLRQARIEAEAASEAKSAFLTDMSHELRTPLHGLLGMLALLRQTAPMRTDTAQADAEVWLATADASAQHLQRLLDELLDLGKLESGTLTLAREPVRLHPLLAEVVHLMRPLAAAKSLQLAWRIDPEVPEWMVSDATRLRQILYNLIGNALKFSDQGRVQIDARPWTGRDGLPGLELDVRDDGIGIDALTLRQLFRRYSRSNDPLAAQVGGSGLGLSISRKLALLMGGDLEAQSTPGEGSVFRLRLPLQPGLVPPASRTAHGTWRDAGATPPEATASMPTTPSALPTTAGCATDVPEVATAAPAAAPAPASTRAAPASAPTPPSTTCPTADPPSEASTPPDPARPRPLRVLVADDHPVNRLYLQALLGHMGHASSLAEHGQTALELQHQDPHDLILMDVHMPVMDGLTAMEAIRALPGPAGRVPMLALTADVFAQTRERCLQAGADEVLTKPLSLDALQAVLDRHGGTTGFAARPTDTALAGLATTAHDTTTTPTTFSCLEPACNGDEACHTPAASGPGMDSAALRPAAAGVTTEAGAAATAPPPAPALLDDQASLRLRSVLGLTDVRGLYRGFFDQAEDAARRIDQACREQDVQGLRRAAHMVKGAALNLGLPALGACAERLSREDLQLQPGREQEQSHEFARLLRASREHCLQRDLLP